MSRKNSSRYPLVSGTFSVPVTKGTVLTIGTFDGVHRGHRRIFRRVREIGSKNQLESCAITFSLPPRLFFSPTKTAYLLSTVTEKKFLLGIECPGKIVFFGFDDAFSKISARDFFRDTLVRKFKARKIVVGYNFCFGKKREGNIATLKSEARPYGIGVEVIPPLKVNGLPISSGRIRAELLKGNLSEANRLLGRPYFAIGKVAMGQGLGKSLGFPTVNLKCDPLKILPRGVFVVRVCRSKSRKRYFGIANVGCRPTVAQRQKLSFEVYLLRFKGNLYGETLSVEFLKKLRDEKKFSSLATLKRQLEKDRRAAELYIGVENC